MKKEIKVAKWGTPKKYFKKHDVRTNQITQYQTDHRS
jgi:hypothetical protein